MEEGFVKYRSLVNHYHKKDMSYILKDMSDEDLKNTKWVALEKLNGANFSFLVKDHIIYCASRETILDHKDNIDFYRGWKDIREKYIPSFREILCNHGMDVQVYGELIGTKICGNPHRLNKKEFYVFDIRVGDKFLSHNDVVRLCEHAGFKHVPVIEIYTLDELMKIDNLFDSKIEPSLENQKAFSEGFVFKPIDEYDYFSRPTIKSKNNLKTEKIKRERKEVELSEHDKEIFNRILELINLNRVYAVVSKIGTPKSKDFGKIMGLTVQDAINEFDSLYGEYNLDDKNNFMKLLNKECTLVLRSDWINIFED